MDGSYYDDLFSDILKMSLIIMPDTYGTILPQGTPVFHYLALGHLFHHYSLPTVRQQFQQKTDYVPP